MVDEKGEEEAEAESRMALNGCTGESCSDACTAGTVSATLRGGLCTDVSESLRRLLCKTSKQSNHVNTLD